MLLNLFFSSLAALKRDVDAFLPDWLVFLPVQ
jgi:hypothetical protein